ncbi:hypothetical protein CPB83DRAFT_952022, partial [Crepidotus variabilis]
LSPGVTLELVQESFVASRGGIAYSFDSEDPTRNHVESFAVTISYQISVVHAPTRALIAQTVHVEPLIFTKSLDTQLNELVARPLIEISEIEDVSPLPPQIIIIDGLDHCLDKVAQSDLVEALCMLATKLNNHGVRLRILITSRTSPHLGMWFHPRIPLGKLSCIALEEHDAGINIRLFLEEHSRRFNFINQTRVWVSSVPDCPTGTAGQGELCQCVCCIRFGCKTRSDKPFGVNDCYAPGSRATHDPSFFSINSEATQ